MHRFAPHQFQLDNRVVEIAGFAEDNVADKSDLIAAYDQRIRPNVLHRASFGAGEPQGKRLRRFSGQRRFVRIGGGDFERDIEAVQQLTAIPRGRSQDEARRGRVGHGVSASTGER